MMVVSWRDGGRSVADGEDGVGVSWLLVQSQVMAANAEVQAATGAMAGHSTARLDTVSAHTRPSPLHSLLKIIARNVASRRLVPT